MYSAVELALFYKFANAPILGYPYPHFFIQDVFPKNFYAELRRNLPDPSLMIPIEQARPVVGYKERFVLEVGGKHLDMLPEDKRPFWRDFCGWLLSGRFARLALEKFRPWVDSRFENEPESQFYDEALLVEDVTRYALGPHTDSPRKVVTMLFYLPPDLSQSHLGTSIYIPNDPHFRCPGGPHYGYDNFIRLHTMPFLPNSLFVFVKSDHSFHGVEPVTDPDTKRWLLLFDVYVRRNQQVQPVAAAPAEAPAQAPAVKFAF
jgi:hypothetical protein